MDVIDLHCDLLVYLAMAPERTPHDRETRCSIQQRKTGKVKWQTLAIYTETSPYSVMSGLKQIEIYQTLQSTYPEAFLPAFENASGFSLETEHLDTSLKRLETLLAKIHPLYISLTWNGENRFAGGSGSQAGLKEDGRQLLQFLSGRNIAIDFSHATDQTARETLDYIDANGLDLPVMASHSNFRKVQNHIRNLPDDIAKEIIRRKGLIGINFYTRFLPTPEHLYKNFEYGLELGGENALAFGADFFYLEDHPTLQENPGYFEEMANASKYPQLLQSMQKKLGLSDLQLQKIASRNANYFIKDKNLCAIS